MGDGTTISWTNATWNVTRGCRRVSTGCEHCYAERQAIRMSGPGGAYHGLVKSTTNGPRWTGEVSFDVSALNLPLHWKSPRTVFVDSMSDLFYDKFTDEQIAAVFAVMAACPQHTFQVLTKRARRMCEWFTWFSSHGYAPGQMLEKNLYELAKLDDSTDLRFTDEEWLCALTNVVNGYAAWPHQIGDGNPLDGSRPRWPLPNVWLGVSVENQDAADERIPNLLATPAAVRFLSCEPLLGPIDFGHQGPIMRWLRADSLGVGWVIAGCESGPGARPCDVAWLRSLRDQCAAAGVPFFLKQAEESADCGEDRQLDVGDDDSIAFDDGSKLKARRPGGNHIIELPYLDGVQHKAMP